jgi:DNA-directed RNA polymerase subunit RPC12/RpoP
MIVYCKKCGAKIDDDSKFCSVCGFQLQSDLDVKLIQMKCSDCGAVMDLSEDAILMECPYCKSKKLISMSDEVRIEKIRSNDNKEVSFEKIHSNERLEQEHLKNKQDKFEIIVGVILAVFIWIIVFLIFTSLN